MSKSTVFVGAVAVAALALGGAGLGYSLYQGFMNQERIEPTGEVTAIDLTKVAGYEPDAEAGDLSISLSHELQGGNTKLLWNCGKVLTGKRQDFTGTWDRLGGAIVFNPKLQQLKALEVRILIASIVGYGSTQPAPPPLTNTLIKEQWFNTNDHPEATLTATEFVARSEGQEIEGSPEDWTHLIKGVFVLNGVEKQVEIPARVAFTGEAVSIVLGFAINRMDYGVDGAGVPGSEVDEQVVLAAEVTASQDPASATNALAGMLQDYGTTIAAQTALIQQMQSQLAVLTETVSNLERKVAAGVGPAVPAVDTSNLPAKFTDKVVYPSKEIPFEMVLVPGDAAAGIGPFYMASHEVTWEMFNDWAYSTDIDVNTSATLQARDLRPSPLYEDCTQVKFGKGDRPAISMSRTTAEAYAKWLTETTGRNYRIPTDAEWQHALKAGGGIPQDRAALLAQAWLDDNAERFGGGGSSDVFDPFAASAPEGEGKEEEVGMSALVGTAQPNSLGIYDLLGNAAEWVVGTGAERIVRGGHFQLPADQLSTEWKSIENQKVWNATYPQKPNSRFWYRDHYYQGIRLVCDPVNIPE